MRQDGLIRKNRMTRLELAAKIAYRRDVLERMEAMQAPNAMLDMQRASIQRAQVMMTETGVEKGLFEVEGTLT